MTSIIKATAKDAALLSGIAASSFIESHGSSAPARDIDIYVADKYREHIFEEQLSDPKNNYYFIYHNNTAAGYSNIIFNEPYDSSPINHIAKLDRIYLLKEFYNLKLGWELFEFNLSLAKSNHQRGIWLYVWKENNRAVNFYTKAGFKIIGSYDFKISPTHSNPNHRMLLQL